MVKLSRGILWLGLLALLAGCAAPASRMDRDATRFIAPAAPPAQPAPAAGVAREVEVRTEAVVVGAPADSQRMIIRTADLSLIVTRAEPAVQSIRELAVSLGGYVADSQAWREGEQLRARVTVRIPAEKLDGALADIKKLAVRVEREQVSGKDVTEEYTDLNAQLVNLEATEKELRELLTEVRQKTQKAEDVLQVYQELSRIRGEIERVKGRIQYLGNLTALATLNVELIPDILAKPVVEPGWRPLETLKNASRGLVNAFKTLADVLIYLVILVLPILLIVAGVIYLIIRLLRRLFRRK
ncbi:MAG: DUF4349 domain-containing protein [Chloroflexi bacterium]|nr:DUF4349 domain-containing protein [Chloroflexota bacterium]